MDKRTRTILIVVGVAIAGYLAWRWWHDRQASSTDSGSGGSGLGSNLNSIAPELVGGSSGPDVGPAVAVPINITLSSTTPPSDISGPIMANNQGWNSASPLMSQTAAAMANPGVMTADSSSDDLTESPDTPVSTGFADSNESDAASAGMNQSATPTTAKTAESHTTKGPGSTKVHHPVKTKVPTHHPINTKHRGPPARKASYGPVKK